MNTIPSSPDFLVVFYCVLVLLASLAGGLLPSLVRLTHARLQAAISFVAGLMLGLALLHLLPHATHELHSPEASATWFIGGFLVMFFLQRFMPFHHHDVSDGEPAGTCGHTHTLAEHSSRHLSWISVALGLSIHSIFDGLAMAAAIASGAHGHGGALGLGTVLAVIMHKPFGAMAITTLMASGGASRGWRHGINLAFALVTPLGALLFYFGVSQFVQTHENLLGYALAFCAGTFLCIACSDLLPEVQFHTHDRFALSFALLAGVGVAVLIGGFGHSAHQHSDDTEVPASQTSHTSSVHEVPHMHQAQHTN